MTPHSSFGCVLMQTKDLKGISIDLLVPGMLVNASVRSILENGIMLSFLTYFTGTVSLLIFIRQLSVGGCLNWELYLFSTSLKATIFFYLLGIYRLICSIYNINSLIRTGRMFTIKIRRYFYLAFYLGWYYCHFFADNCGWFSLCLWINF